MRVVISRKKYNRKNILIMCVLSILCILVPGYKVEAKDEYTLESDTMVSDSDNSRYMYYTVKDDENSYISGTGGAHVLKDEIEGTGGPVDGSEDAAGRHYMIVWDIDKENYKDQNRFDEVKSWITSFISVNLQGENLNAGGIELYMVGSNKSPKQNEKSGEIWNMSDDSQIDDVLSAEYSCVENCENVDRFVQNIDSYTDSLNVVVVISSSDRYQGNTVSVDKPVVYCTYDVKSNSYRWLRYSGQDSDVENKDLIIDSLSDFLSNLMWSKYDNTQINEEGFKFVVNEDGEKICSEKIKREKYSLDIDQENKTIKVVCGDLKLDKEPEIRLYRNAGSEKNDSAYEEELGVFDGLECRYSVKDDKADTQSDDKTVEAEITEVDSEKDADYYIEIDGEKHFVSVPAAITFEKISDTSNYTASIVEYPDAESSTIKASGAGNKLEITDIKLEAYGKDVGEDTKQPENVISTDNNIERTGVFRVPHLKKCEETDDPEYVLYINHEKTNIFLKSKPYEIKDTDITNEGNTIIYIKDTEKYKDGDVVFQGQSLDKTGIPDGIKGQGWICQGTYEIGKSKDDEAFDVAVGEITFSAGLIQKSNKEEKRADSILVWMKTHKLLCIIIASVIVLAIVLLVVLIIHARRKNRSNSIRKSGMSGLGVASVRPENSMEYMRKTSAETIVLDRKRRSGQAGSRISANNTRQIQVQIVGRNPKVMNVFVNGSAFVGRADICEIFINDAAVSRQHFALECVDGDMFIMPLVATNGTKLNGVRIHEKHQLFPNDQIIIGTTGIIVRW